jgi:hypothetical protein
MQLKKIYIYNPGSIRPPTQVHLVTRSFKVESITADSPLYLRFMFPFATGRYCHSFTVAVMIGYLPGVVDVTWSSSSCSAAVVMMRVQTMPLKDRKS